MASRSPSATRRSSRSAPVSSEIRLDQLPEQGNLVVRASSWSGPSPATGNPGRPRTTTARCRSGRPLALNERMPPAPPTSYHRLVAASLSLSSIICCGQRPVAGRQPGAATSAFGQQRLEHVELDHARLGLRLALAQVPGLAGAQIVDGGQDGAGPARQVRGRGRPERILVACPPAGVARGEGAAEERARWVCTGAGEVTFSRAAADGSLVPPTTPAGAPRPCGRARRTRQDQARHGAPRDDGTAPSARSTARMGVRGGLEPERRAPSPRACLSHRRPTS